MFAKKIKCQVISTRRLSPTVFTVRFRSNQRIRFKPGQFISVRIPGENGKKGVWRCYSFANGPEEAMREGYEICVKEAPKGKGTTFLKGLKKGDTFLAKAPFGLYTYKTKARDRIVVFIATGSGIGPIRSMIRSQFFKDHPPKHAILIFGCREENEILYKNEFEPYGIETVLAISANPEAGTTGDRRVTDVLAHLPKDWPWHRADFYICGGGEMVKNVTDILRSGHGVAKSAVHFESFSLPTRSDRRKKGISRKKWMVPRPKLSVHK